MIPYFLVVCTKEYKQGYLNEGVWEGKSTDAKGNKDMSLGGDGESGSEYLKGVLRKTIDQNKGGEDPHYLLHQ